MINPNANPFLTNNDVRGACEDATVLHMEVLYQLITAAQPSDWLIRMQRQSQNTLDTSWKTAVDSATAGNIPGAASLMVVILKEWGRYAAFQHVLDADAQGMLIDLWDGVTYDTIRQDFSLAVGTKMVTLITELHNAWLAGEMQRKQDGQQTLMHDYTALHGIAMQVIGRQDTSLQQAHLVNQQYAETAFQGVKQAQQSVHWMQEGAQHMYDFVLGTQANMVSSMQTFQGHLEQNMPSYIDDANRKRSRQFFGCLLGICVFGLGLFCLAAYIGTHLVGH